MWVSHVLPFWSAEKSSLWRGQQGGGSEGGAVMDMGQVRESSTGATLSLPSALPDNLGEQPLFAWASPCSQALWPGPQHPEQGLAHRRDPAGRSWPTAARRRLRVQLRPSEKRPHLCGSHDPREKTLNPAGLRSESGARLCVSRPEVRKDMPKFGVECVALG